MLARTLNLPKAAVPQLLRPLATASKIKDAPLAASQAQFGKQVADEASGGQMMHDIGKGRYEYLSDFAASLTKGPVKLEFGDRQPTAEERAQQDAQEKALTMIQRSLWVGSLMAVGGCAAAWMITKRIMGVSSIAEFGEAMSQKMPKVSGDMEQSMIGRQLKEKSLESRDKISEDPELTAWRRSMRSKFNTPEGAALARQNSLVLANKRREERIIRSTTGDTVVAKKAPPTAPAPVDDAAAALASPPPS